jgi:hypothetical protein
MDDPEEETTPTPDAENEVSPHLRAGARLRSERKASSKNGPEPARTSDLEVEAYNGYSGDPLRKKGNWLEAWLDTYGVTASGLSFFNRAVLLPTRPGLSIRGEPEAQELLIVGDLDREDIPMVVNHILFLVQDLKRIRTTFNTKEAYRLRTELLDPALHKALVLDFDVESYEFNYAEAHQFPDHNDKAGGRSGNTSVLTSGRVNRSPTTHARSSLLRTHFQGQGGRRTACAKRAIIRLASPTHSRLRRRRPQPWIESTIQLSSSRKRNAPKRFSRSTIGPAESSPQLDKRTNGPNRSNDLKRKKILLLPQESSDYAWTGGSCNLTRSSTITNPTS